MSSSPISLSSSEPAALAALAALPAAAAVAVLPAAAVAPFGTMSDVTCTVDVFLGTGRITVRDCMKLQQSSIIRLEQLAGSDLDVRVHGVAIAVGEAIVVDESAGVRLTAVAAPPTSGVQ